ncbi:MAG: molybdopterin-dependent oxidoreductase [Candidatus Promineifilaceae bacterium]
MKKAKVATGALVGGISSIALIGMFYLGRQLFDLPLVPFDLFDWLARVLPGDVITIGIDTMVSLIEALNFGSTSYAAKLMEQLIAASMFIFGGVGLGAGVGYLSFRTGRSGRQIGLFVGALVFAAISLVEFSLESTEMTLVSILWIGALLLSWGLVVGVVVDVTEQDEVTEEVRASRRSILLRVAAGSFGVAVGAWGLGRLVGVPDEELGASQPLAPATATPQPQITATAEALASPELTATVTTRDKIPPAPGTRDELTSNKDFYRIDINTFRPVLREEEWTLEVAGLFEKPTTLKLEDLMAYPIVSQPITLNCISNLIGGDLIGTSKWTGLRLRDLLDDLGMQQGAQELMVEAADGFFESVTMMDMMDPRTLLVYGMNDETLPVDHGFPLRIYIPNRYGMKQPKWITKITAIDEEGSGYWVDRGWSKTAHPHVISVIDTIAKDERNPDNRIPIGGIAWAGDRGIQKVELQFNDGDWIPAVLRVPPLGSLTWVQWRYDWDSQPGKYDIRVRATDGSGALQIEEESGVRPNGATGFHSKEVRV